MRKKGKRLRDISIKDVQSFFTDERYKIKKTINDFNSLPQKIFSEMEPVYVVSTGRAGSELLVKLMKASNLGSVHHEPRPRMFYGSKLAYELGSNNIKAIQMAYLNARYDLLKKTFLEDDRFVETNNRLSFFMEALSDLFPKAKFIHLIRHPGAFVRSGIRRKYYRGNENDDARLIPLETDWMFDKWGKATDIEKIGWLWNKTNEIIENAKNKIEPNRVITYHSEDLFKNFEVYNDICRFINHGLLDKAKIQSLIAKPTNRQTQNEFPKWKDWANKDKIELKIVAPLGMKYNFWESND
ncbi:MAG: sulfotransferase [Candidatus Marinimicrobia bacterium]|nr:sulfotransferase [Candidatus Neomarinimicrobiota bacterium]